VADTIYAWINGQGDDLSLVGVYTPETGHLPLVFANRQVATSPMILAAVQQHADQWKRPCRLVRFDGGVTVEEMEPADDPQAPEV
jgi:hypothetical protein